MATDTVEKEEAEAPEETPEALESSDETSDSGINKIKIAGLLVGLIVVMMGIGVIFMPESPDTSDMPDATHDAADPTDDEMEDTQEVEIGTFNCTNSKTGVVNVHIKFKLYAVVQSKNVQNFKDARDQYDARIRDAVNVIARSASHEDLSAPKLDTLKRLLREEINKILRKTYVSKVFIPDWQTTER